MSLKYKIHIKADTDDEVKEILSDFAYILTGLREATKEFNNVYGSAARVKKERWEAKADELIEKHKEIYL